MRIALLRTQVPFVTGGAERHAARLAGALRARGHEAVEVTVPFKWYPGTTLARSILAAKLLDVSEVEGVPIDLAIGLKFPAWLVRHPRKVFWIIHQHRQAYDMWESGDSDLLADPDGAALRQTILEEDRAALGSGAPLFANSRNVAARLERFLGLGAEPLYHPPPLAERLAPGEQGDYIFAPGRINPSKRLELMIEALAQSGRHPRLVVAGTAENPAYLDRLVALARARGVAERIEWLGGIDDETMIRRYAGARAVAFAPKDEDYGYVTLEAMLSGKPVLTVADSGGPLEFVRDGEEGLVTAPRPAALGRAFARIAEDAALAARLGKAAHARYAGLDITWDHVVDRLLSGDPRPSEAAPPPHAGAPARPAPAPEPRPTAAPTPEPEPAPAPDTGEAPEPSPQDAAVEKLRAAIAPPAAPALPFASARYVLSQFRFDVLAPEGTPAPPVDEGLASYLGTHWTRYATTINALDGLDPKTILDVGIFPPLVFEALLAARFPEATLLGLWEGPEPMHHRIRARGAGHADFEVSVAAANGEVDRWPYADGSVELILGMEILEHLALDPHHFFCEANRVLAPGGHMLLTTPNVASHRGVWKALNLQAPYSFGIFVPTGGVYGRHNREYAPQELPRLGEAAGFETVRLSTHDVYDDRIDPATAELLVSREQPLELRGETIFYLARKEGPPRGVPDRFYHGDPTRMAGALALVDGPDPEHGAEIALTNLSRAWWTVEGPRRTILLAEWIDAGGTYHDYLLLDGPVEPVAPGATVHVTLAIDGASAPGAHGHVRLHLYQEGVGSFTGTGRAASLELPCTREAFLRLAGAE